MRTLLCLFLSVAAAGFAATVDTVVENDQVRVLKVTVPPDHSTGMHVHTINRVMLYLDAGQQSTIRENGPTTVQKWGDADPLWSPAIGQHRVELTSDGDVSIVEVEFKEDGPASPQPLTALHPLNADPEHATMEFENDQTRVFRLKYPAGAPIPMHELRNARVVTYITPTDLNTWDESGAKSHSAHQAGDLSWSTSTVRHRAKNLSDGPFEVVVVELK